MDLSKYATNLTALHEKTVWLFKKQSVASDYIGDSYTWESVEALNCNVLPVTDKMSIEVYGPRIEKMMSLYAAPNAPISDGMGIAFTEGAAEPDYTVISVKQRMTHTYALIEVIDIGSQG
jgi:hypothetical protein